MKPVRFERTGAGKARGCIVYVLAVPALTLMFWILASGVTHYLVRSVLKGSQSLATGIVLALFPIILLAVIRIMWKEYRGGPASVVVSDDRMEVNVRGLRLFFPYASLHAVRLKPYYEDLKVVLVPSKGPEFALPADFVPFTILRDALEPTLIRHLEERLDRQVAAGETVRMGESRLLAALRLPWGLLHYVFGIPIICSIVHAHLGIELVMAAPRSFRRGWRGLAGGLEIRSGGVAPAAGVVHRTIPWEDLSVQKFDADGLVLRTRGGATLSVSPYAADYWPGSRWLVARISRPSP
jgi:hypothetical protein